MMTAIFSLALAVGLLVGQAGAAAQVDFSGTWVLDSSRSEGIPEGLQQTMTVKHSGDRVEIETRMTGPQGDRTIPDVYVLNGQELDVSPALVSGGTATGKRSSKWLADRTGFEATERASVEEAEETVTFTVTRKWLLAPDGKTLTIEMLTKGPMGEMKSTRVFAKK